jgi:hypothetical protein
VVGLKNNMLQPMKNCYKVIGQDYLINIIAAQPVENTQIGDVNQQLVIPKHVTQKIKLEEIIKDISK